jgi:hypothetical protein
LRICCRTLLLLLLTISRLLLLLLRCSEGLEQNVVCQVHQVQQLVKLCCCGCAGGHHVSHASSVGCAGHEPALTRLDGVLQFN